MEIVSAPDNNLKAMSAFDLIKQIEAGNLDPKTLSSDQKEICVEILFGRGYSNAMIAEELQVNVKWVYRAVKRIRHEKKLVIYPGYQKELVSELDRNWRIQSSRLTKMSFSEELSVGDRVRAILAAHQIQKNGLEMLERLGYVGKDIAAADAKLIEDARAKKAQEEKDKSARMNTPFMKVMKRLTPLDQELILQELNKGYEKVLAEMIKMGEDILAEKARREAVARADYEKKLQAGGQDTGNDGVVWKIDGNVYRPM